MSVALALGVASGLVALMFALSCLLLRALHKRQENKDIADIMAVAFVMSSACGIVAAVVSLCAFCAVASLALLGGAS